MSGVIRRFEDLVAWQKARQLAGSVFELTRERVFTQDEDLRTQMRSAATSVMSNIAEGFERVSPRDFSHFLLMAKASCAEVRSLLYLAHDIGYMRIEASDKLMSEASECGRVIGGLRASVRRATRAEPGLGSVGRQR